LPVAFVVAIAPQREQQQTPAQHDGAGEDQQRLRRAARASGRGVVGLESLLAPGWDPVARCVPETRGDPVTRWAPEAR
jgi:hypothetical protein